MLCESRNNFNNSRGVYQQKNGRHNNVCLNPIYDTLVIIVSSGVI